MFIIFLAVFLDSPPQRKRPMTFPKRLICNSATESAGRSILLASATYAASRAELV